MNIQGRSNSWLLGYPLSSAMDSGCILAKPTQSWFESGAELSAAKGFDAVFATSGGGNDTALLHNSDGDDVLRLDRDRVAWDSAEFHDDLASFARIVAQATAGRDRLAVDSVLSQAIREYDTGWALNWGDLSLVAEGFELAPRRDFEDCRYG